MNQDPDIFGQIDQVKDAISDLLDLAKQHGATSAEAVISKTKGISVSSRCRELENIEFNQEGALGISVYVGQHKGSASTADLSHKALAETVKAAIDIARYTNEDPYSGLVDESLLAKDIPDLQLYHPHEIDPQEAIEHCIAMEQAAFDHDKRIINSDGASFSSYQGFKVYGNSLGFLEGYPSSRHSMSCSVIAQDGGEMQREYAYTVDRKFNLLKSPAFVGQKAATTAVSMLNPRTLPTAQVPVLFDAEIAVSLFGHFIGAISGGSLYRKSSFLLNSLDTQVMSNGVSIIERPHLLAGLASSPFDSEGVQTIDRDIVTDGVLNTYLLTGYSARKMGMTTTGHAGGIHNWIVESNAGDLQDMLKQLGTGLYVTELMGQGVNTVTGDYSRGAAGFWVENGQIMYPVSEVTIAGNLKDMLKKIVAIGSDVERRGAIQSGSILIEKMQLAGH